MPIIKVSERVSLEYIGPPDCALTSTKAVPRRVIPFSIREIPAREAFFRLASQIAKDLRFEAGNRGPTTRKQGGSLMLTRRGFAGFASCALCGITEFVATAASAEGTPPAPTPGVTRKILSQTDGPVPGYVTLLVEATIEKGTPVARHTHPGVESAYVLEGGFELPVQGQPTRMIKAGDGFRKRLMPAASRAIPTREFSSPTWWRKESRWPPRPDADGPRARELKPLPLKLNRSSNVRRGLDPRIHLLA